MGWWRHSFTWLNRSEKQGSERLILQDFTPKPSRVYWLSISHISLSSDHFSSSLYFIHVEVLIHADLYSSVPFDTYLMCTCSAQNIMRSGVLDDVTMGSRFIIPSSFERLVPSDGYMGPSPWVNKEMCSAILESNQASTGEQGRTK